VLVSTEGPKMAGSMFVGCVDAAVVEEAMDVIRTGRPTCLTYGIPDEDARAVGLSCVSVVHAFVERGGSHRVVPAPRTHGVGATAHVAAVARIRKFLGDWMTVCDARAALATPERIPDADGRVVREPHKCLAEAPVDRRTLDIASNAQSAPRSRRAVDPPTERTETPVGRRTA